MTDKRAAWTKENIGYSAHMARHFPTEYVLRSLCSRSYFGFGKDINAGQKVLDLGCLYLNNLMPFADRGAELFGVEINEDMVAVARERAAAMDIPVQLAAGHNRSLPYADGMFDFVLSINTIHYEDGPGRVIDGLREIARVGKPDCHFLISTAGREHHFHKSAERLSECRYRLATGEFRDGQMMGYFDDEEHFQRFLARIFPRVEIAVVTERYPACSLEFYVAKCARH
jgi:SAM-dependent methyltransferase